MKYLNLKKYSWILTAIILILGFILMQVGLVDYGYVFFILFPLFLGFSLGTLFKTGLQIIYLTLGILIGSFALIMFGIEGFVCVIMLLPIFILAVWIGYAIAKSLKVDVENDSKKLAISILP